MTTPTMDAAHCKACGSPAKSPIGSIGDAPAPESCSDCPPMVCVSCGHLDSLAEPCPCWVSLEGMCLADIKAVFARDGSLNIGGLK